ncbi:hypothetical protein F7725_017496 [Dissostichus mawsoni]|uniref:Uncharacterized protein n=1 Tax=Dissostichus mawsoni TaxID=36200 RepID=A0A7J5Z5G1_DISMA|nr:hypothetical protein F7725_017496 [Dissostichus mawsoni]
MKIHKKDKQQMLTGVLKHTPPPASAAACSSASDQKSNAQNTVPTIPRGHLVVGPKDQLPASSPRGQHGDVQSLRGGRGPCRQTLGRGSATPFIPERGGRWRGRRQGEEETKEKGQERTGERKRGGGGKGKHQTKETEGGEVDHGGHSEEEQGAQGRKGRKGEKGAKDQGEGGEDGAEGCGGGRTTVVPVPVPVKVPGKRGRKPKVKIIPPVPPSQAPPPTPAVHIKEQVHHDKNHRQANSKTPVPSAPKQRGRKPRSRRSAGGEEEEGKRRNQEQAAREGAESDDTTSTPAPNLGGEECQDPLDHTKRRSGRQVKRRKYNEDLDFKVVDDDGETIAVLGAGRISALNATALAWQAEEPPEDEANIIEKILSVKSVKKETSSSEDQVEETEEFYVNSYMHCKWATLEELEKDPRIHQKIKRFRTKQAQTKHLFTESDEDLFNPDYVEVDRVLEVAVTTDTETGEDRPLPEKWQKLDNSRAYRNINQPRIPVRGNELVTVQLVQQEKLHPGR